ncbi:MAG: hypothetical protein KAU31_13415, partial [Spirochaetaceae bacterium]|nr:hypothetical protein [Spirochaetaceae bacterium]
SGSSAAAMLVSSVAGMEASDTGARPPQEVSTSTATATVSAGIHLRPVATLVLASILTGALLDSRRLLKRRAVPPGAFEYDQAGHSFALHAEDRARARKSCFPGDLEIDALQAVGGSLFH